MFGDVGDPAQAGVGPEHLARPALHRDDPQLAADPEVVVEHPRELADRHAVPFGDRVEPDERLELRVEHRAVEQRRRRSGWGGRAPRLPCRTAPRLPSRTPSSTRTCTGARRRPGCRTAARRCRRASPRSGAASRRRGCGRAGPSSRRSTSRRSRRRRPTPRMPCSGPNSAFTRDLSVAVHRVDERLARREHAALVVTIPTVRPAQLAPRVAHERVVAEHASAASMRAARGRGARRRRAATRRSAAPRRPRRGTLRGSRSDELRLGAGRDQVRLRFAREEVLDGGDAARRRGRR